MENNHTQEINGTFYHKDTPRQIVNILERVRQNNTRIRVYFGDVTTGKAWAEEYGVIGTVNRSTGTRKIPLLVHNERSLGGGAMLDNCIVKIMETQSKYVLYQHPSFDNGVWELGTPPDTIGKVNLRTEGYTHAVNHNGKNHANFKNEASARHYMEFMQGTRMAK